MKLTIATLSSVLALSVAAQAADVIVEETPPIVVEEVFSWSGAYIGGFGAYAFGDREYNDDGALGGDEDFDVDSDGGLFGVQVGYDHQINNLVIGVVADIAYSTNEAEETLDIPGIGTIEGTSELEYLGTVRGRLGYAVDRTLFYAHGGFAYGSVSYDVSTNGVDLEIDDEDRSGYVVGAGVEHAFTDHISGQLEYSFADLGDEEITGDFIGSGDISEDLQLHTIKAAVNFRF